MKNWTWKRWTSLGVTIAFIVTIVTLHLIQPEISYAFAECMTDFGFVLGGFAGYLIKDKVKTE